MAARARAVLTVVASMLAVLSSIGCGDDEATSGAGGAGGAGATSTSATGATSSTNTGATSSASSSVASSGSTTAASTGGGACTPGEEQACYSGPAGTEGVGTCHAGTATCNERGTAFGPCIGEVLPGLEPCGSSKDENCDGVILPCVMAD